MAMSYNSSKIGTKWKQVGRKIPFKGSFLFLITIMQLCTVTIENREILDLFGLDMAICQNNPQVDTGSVDYLHLPVLFVDFIRELFAALSHYSHSGFLVVISGFMLASCRKTIASCLRVVGVKTHFSLFHRFLSRYVWESKDLVVSLFELIVNLKR